VNLTETQSAVFALVRRFVERQQLVFDALMDLRPHFVIYADHRTKLTDKEGQEVSRLRLKYYRSSPSGYWGTDNEWEYYVHGGGCRLTHTVTKEPLDWDAPNIYRFDKFWLVSYLEWLFQQQTDDEWVHILKMQFAERSVSLQKGIFSKLHEFIFPILEELQQLGVLSEPDNLNWYILIDVSRSDQP
jgi:hypothetical protein